MASIEKRARAGQVRWLVRYRDPTGRQRARTFPRKVDAEAWLAETQLDLLRGTWRDPKRGRMTLAAWVELWRATTANLRPSSRARDDAYLAGYILPTFGAYPLAAVDQLAVRRWVAELAARGLAPATVAKAYQLLGKIMAAAVDAGMIAANPARRVPLPKVEREPPRFLTPAEVAQLAGAIVPRYRALVLVGAYGGLRIGELAGLRRSRVDILRGVVDVDQVVVEVRGRLHAGPPKTRAGRRRVGLPRPVAEELAGHLAAYAGPEPDALVFTAPEGGPLRVNAFRARAWRPVVAAAGLGQLRIHDLRHTAVSLWVAAGASPKEVAARAGHTSVRTVLDVYGGLYPESDAALRERLEAAYQPPTEPPAGEVIELPSR